MKKYQVTARKYRPQLFQEIVAQESIVTTLKNAIKLRRIAHAYLFSGSRGTGKTTMARVLAKALNCPNLSEDQEPCNCCTSCKEITAGISLDVLECDGASNRGIENIRQINETVGYAASSGNYKIYIIDEVHMLTKEAFNALLKTLEEPPAKVIFLFATTEPHKILPTILSRCQRFNLQRIPIELIVKKLQHIADTQDISIQTEALFMIANKAEGGLRDAESLFDQIIAFHEGEITPSIVCSVLGTVTQEIFLELDEAGPAGNLLKAFEIAEKLFAEGKDLTYFMEELINHFRTLLLIKLGVNETPMLLHSSQQREAYIASAKLYSQEQLLTIQEFLLEAQQNIKFAPSIRIALESLLLKIIRSHRRIPVELLVKRLAELETTIATGIPVSSPPSAVPTLNTEKASDTKNHWISEDPTPTQKDLPQIAIPTKKEQETRNGVKAGSPEKGSHISDTSLGNRELAGSAFSQTVVPPMAVPPIEISRPQQIDRKKQSQHDTLLQFAAIELEGTIRKK